MFFFRWVFSLPFAVLVTAGLFILMAGLIQNPLDGLQSPKPYADIDIRMKPEPEPPTKGRPPREKLPESPPVEIELPAPNGSPGPRIVPPGNDSDGVAPIKNVGVMSAPVIKSAPPYPENCRSKNAEGRVVVQFDVTPEGNVVNPAVIETPNSCFNRTVISAVSRWKYPPANQNGHPVMRYGVVEVFDFQLQE